MEEEKKCSPELYNHWPMIATILEIRFVFFGFFLYCSKVPKVVPGTAKVTKERGFGGGTKKHHIFFSFLETIVGLSLIDAC